MANKEIRASQVGESFLKSVDILLDQRLNKLQYDKTVLCTIKTLPKKGEREYTVSDGTSTFRAYSNSGDYSLDEQVYVKVPNGDMNEQKMIISKYVADDNLLNNAVYINPLDTIIESYRIEETFDNNNSLIANGNILEKEVWGDGIFLVDNNNNPKLNAAIKSIKNLKSSKKDKETSLKNLQGQIDFVKEQIANPDNDIIVKYLQDVLEQYEINKKTLLKEIADITLQINKQIVTDSKIILDKEILGTNNALGLSVNIQTEIPEVEIERIDENNDIVKENGNTLNSDEIQAGIYSIEIELVTYPTAADRLLDQYRHTQIYEFLSTQMEGNIYNFISETNQQRLFNLAYKDDKYLENIVVRIKQYNDFIKQTTNEQGNNIPIDPNEPNYEQFKIIVNNIKLVFGEKIQDLQADSLYITADTLECKNARYLSGTHQINTKLIKSSDLNSYIIDNVDDYNDVFGGKQEGCIHFYKFNPIDETVEDPLAGIHWEELESSSTFDDDFSFSWQFLTKGVETEASKKISNNFVSVIAGSQPSVKFKAIFEVPTLNYVQQTLQQNETIEQLHDYLWQLLYKKNSSISLDHFNTTYWKPLFRREGFDDVKALQKTIWSSSTNIFNSYLAIPLGSKDYNPEEDVYDGDEIIEDLRTIAPNDNGEAETIRDQKKLIDIRLEYIFNIVRSYITPEIGKIKYYRSKVLEIVNPNVDYNVAMKSNTLTLSCISSSGNAIQRENIEEGVFAIYDSNTNENLYPNQEYQFKAVYSVNNNVQENELDEDSYPQIIWYIPKNHGATYTTFIDILKYVQEYDSVNGNNNYKIEYVDKDFKPVAKGDLFNQYFYKISIADSSQIMTKEDHDYITTFPFKMRNKYSVKCNEFNTVYCELTHGSVSFFKEFRIMGTYAKLNEVSLDTVVELTIEYKPPNSKIWSTWTALPYRTASNTSNITIKNKDGIEKTISSNNFFRLRCRIWDQTQNPRVDITHKFSTENILLNYVTSNGDFISSTDAANHFPWIISQPKNESSNYLHPYEDKTKAKFWHLTRSTSTKSPAIWPNNKDISNADTKALLPYINNGLILKCQVQGVKYNNTLNTIKAIPLVKTSVPADLEGTKAIVYSGLGTNPNYTKYLKFNEDIAKEIYTSNGYIFQLYKVKQPKDLYSSPNTTVITEKQDPVLSIIKSDKLYSLECSSTFTKTPGYTYGIAVSSVTIEKDETGKEIKTITPFYSTPLVILSSPGKGAGSASWIDEKVITKITDNDNTSELISTQSLSGFAAKTITKAAMKAAPQLMSLSLASEASIENENQENNNQTTSTEDKHWSEIDDNSTIKDWISNVKDDFGFNNDTSDENNYLGDYSNNSEELNELIDKTINAGAIYDQFDDEQILLNKSELIPIKERFTETAIGVSEITENNGISGIFMGKRIEYTDSDFDNNGLLNKTGLDKEVNGVYGLYGYDNSEASFGFKADGTAFIGKEGRGQIRFDGHQGLIFGGDINLNNNEVQIATSGIIIDLDGTQNANGTYNNDPFIEIKGSGGKISLKSGIQSSDDDQDSTFLFSVETNLQSIKPDLNLSNELVPALRIGKNQVELGPASVLIGALDKNEELLGSADPYCKEQVLYMGDPASCFISFIPNSWAAPFIISNVNQYNNLDIPNNLSTKFLKIMKTGKYIGTLGYDKIIADNTILSVTAEEIESQPNGMYRPVTKKILNIRAPLNIYESWGEIDSEEYIITPAIPQRYEIKSLKDMFIIDETNGTIKWKPAIEDIKILARVIEKKPEEES